MENHPTVLEPLIYDVRQQGVYYDLTNDLSRAMISRCGIHLYLHTRTFRVCKEAEGESCSKLEPAHENIL